MNKDEMIELLRTDVEGWNKFRRDNRYDVFNFRGVDLQKANLQNANLLGANLQNANLLGANLQNANLLGANLQDANLQYADLRGANLLGIILLGANLQYINLQDADLRNSFFNKPDLRYANLQGVHIRGADLQGADLQGANLQNADFRNVKLQSADLKNAKLKGAKLKGAKLRKAQLFKTHFSSRSQLNELLLPLTENQLANCIFDDEHNFYKQQAKSTIKEDVKISETGKLICKALKINFTDHTSWTPRDLSLFLGALHLSYSNLLYLMNTDDTDLDRIQYVLEKNTYFPPLEYEISIVQIHSGSLSIDISKLDWSDYPKHLKIVLSTLVMLGTLSASIAYTAKTIAETNLVNEQTHHLETARENGLLVIPNNYIAIHQENERQQQACIEKLYENKEIHDIVAKTDLKNSTVAANPPLFVNATASLSRAYLELAKSYKTDPEITLPEVEDE
ncbi:pentapeptide repeat-containing protein [Maridesulfovibrio frigidus]|uniref:pentapeptide repeat-containing protein n=1 Tax=Maridesulfovibrio frigidus TaxID=340956 RepID=UPI00146FBF93|nr:pentapeptide repeat-containing protein [Maridesulfovibrio frigidus]